MQFSTVVGQKGDAKRQESVLLSDTLGASMLVEFINSTCAPGICTASSVHQGMSA